MKLYHGTTLENAKGIEKYGLRATPIIPGGTGVPAYSYMSYERGLAESYGEAVFEVESDDLDQAKLDTYHEGIGLIHNYSEDIPPELLIRIQ